MKHYKASCTRLCIPTAVLCALVSCTQLQATATLATVPVMVGGEDGMDACGAYGIVSGLKEAAGNFLALRNRPGLEGEIVYKLINNQPLWMCSEHGEWIGVVVPADGEDCGVSTPTVEQMPYDGPCKSGWVFSQHVELLAG